MHKAGANNGTGALVENGRHGGCRSAATTTSTSAAHGRERWSSTDESPPYGWVWLCLTLYMMVAVECIPGLANKVLLASGVGALVGGWALPSVVTAARSVRAWRRSRSLAPKPAPSPNYFCPAGNGTSALVTRAERGGEDAA